MRQQGNVLFLILLAVVLFAALSYAVTQSSRGASNADKELEQIAQAESENCSISVETALMRLEMIRGCSDDEISYELPDGSNANSNAPADGSCNVFSSRGGGAVVCGPWEDSCSEEHLAALVNVGDRCDSIVYSGTYGGSRTYTTVGNSGSRSWNNGTEDWVITSATSGTNGFSNTASLIASSDIGAPYHAAALCRSIGTGWYLPSLGELQHLYNNRSAIGGFDTSIYWSSTERFDSAAKVIKFSDGTEGFTEGIKDLTNRVRCMRRE